MNEKNDSGTKDPPVLGYRSDAYLNELKARRRQLRISEWLWDLKIAVGCMTVVVICIIAFWITL